MWSFSAAHKLALREMLVSQAIRDSRTANEDTSYKDLLDKYPEILDIFKVFVMGQKKHGDSWLEANGKGMSRKEQFASLTRHAAKYYMGEELDEESKLPHELHIACRAIMEYIRKQRGLNHPDDIN